VSVKTECPLRRWSTPEFHRHRRSTYRTTHGRAAGISRGLAATLVSVDSRKSRGYSVHLRASRCTASPTSQIRCRMMRSFSRRREMARSPSRSAVRPSRTSVYMRLYDYSEYIPKHRTLQHQQVGYYSNEINKSVYLRQPLPITMRQIQQTRASARTHSRLE